MKKYFKQWVYIIAILLTAGIIVLVVNYRDRT